MPDISILIVNYNGAAHIRSCLDALAEQSYPLDRFEVIVLDNASPDGSGLIVEKEYPWVRYISSKTNLGFSEGNNYAATFANADWLVLLNNDTIADPFWLEELVNEQKRTEADLVASKLILSPDGQEINSGGNVMLRSGWTADDGFRQRDVGQFEADREIFAGCGAALMIRNRSQPIFPKEYFAYYEDTVLAWQALGRGEKTVYASRAVVMHVCGASAGEKSDLFRFLNERNRLLSTVTFADPFLAGWSMLKFFAKSLLKLHDKPQRKAFFSFLFHLPQTVVKRYDARSAWQNRRIFS